MNWKVRLIKEHSLQVHNCVSGEHSQYTSAGLLSDFNQNWKVTIIVIVFPGSIFDHLLIEQSFWAIVLICDVTVWQQAGPCFFPIRPFLQHLRKCILAKIST